MFGHQDDLAYGIDWWAQEDRSDVLALSGKYPAVFGWDLGKIGDDRNIDSVRFQLILASIKKVYKKGGINTISWHLDNPLTGGNSWDTQPTVEEILPGGKAHEAYLTKLDLFADFIKKCKSGFTKIPIIFRPFHEHNGSWFWWGRDITEEQDYISLWRFTVDYLRETKKLHQLIYAFSPDRSRLDLDGGAEAYLYGYPGDEYVDVIGLDDYWDVGHGHNQRTVNEQMDDLYKSLRLLTAIAKEKGKVAALTETGNDGIVPDNWFTNRLLDPINRVELPIAWVLVWRNASTDHFFVPFDGHPNAEDFRQFEKNQFTLFLSDFESPYRK